MVFCSHDLKTLWNKNYITKKNSKKPPKNKQTHKQPTQKAPKDPRKRQKKPTKNPPKTKKTTTNKKIQIQLLNKENDDKGKKIKLMPQRLKNF